MATAEDDRRRRRPKEETRDAILKTASEIVARDGVPERIDIRLATVLEEMGLTSGAAYNIWSNQDEFQRELALEIVRNFYWAGPNASDLEMDLTADDPLAELRRLADMYFDAFTNRDEIFMALRFWGTKHPTADLAEAVRAGYAANHDSWKKLYTASLEWTQREIRELFTIDDFVVAATAVTEGAALRHKFDPERLTTAAGRTLHGELMVAIFEHFTKPIVVTGQAQASA